MISDAALQLENYNLLSHIHLKIRFCSSWIVFKFAVSLITKFYFSLELNMELPEGETGSVGVASSATSASQEQVVFKI